MKVIGIVVRVYTGSGTAIYLRLKNKDYLLRRLGTEASEDYILDDLVGKKIKADGVINGDTFLLTAWSKVL